MADRNAATARNIADLHCHYFPPEAPGRANVPIQVESESDGYRFTTETRSMLLGPELFELESQIEDMRRQGVSVRAVSVPPFTFQYELPAEDGIRWSRAVNDGIADAIGPYPEALRGLATLPLQEPDAAVEELDRAIRDLGLHGVEIATNINSTELDAPELAPFWARAEAFGIPVLIHPHYVLGAPRLTDYYLVNLIGNPVETALAGTRLIFGGVLERYPGLRIVLSHGGGALPQLVGRLRHGFEVRDEPKIRASAPLESIRRLYYDTIVFEPSALRHMIELVGAGQIVLGTDYPFDMGETDPVDFVQRSGLDQSQVETILGNGARLLDTSTVTTDA